MIINEEGKKYTIRKQPPGDLLPGAHAVDREYTVMTALKNTNVPIPNTRLFCNDKSIIGSPFFVYDYVEGQFFKDATLNAISSPETKSKMYFHLLDSLARIHAVNVDDVGLGSYGKKVDPSSDKRVATGYIARQIKTWSRNYKAAETEVIPDMEFLIAELPDLLPSQAEPHSCLVHGDYRMDNVLFKTNPTDGIAAILDWELSTLGDGLSDLAYLCLSYSLSPTNQFMKGLAGVDLSNTGIPTLEQAINIYIQQLTYHSNNSNIHSRLTIDECQKLMDYYIAFSLFRCTAILQGVYKRSILGNASAANASDGLKFAKESAHIGAQFLTKYKSNIARGPVVGSTFHKSHSSSSNITTITTPYPRLGPEPPALFTGSGLLSDRAKDTLSKVKEFVRNEVFPREKEIQDAGYEGNNRWQHHPALDELKAKAKAQGLWNLFLPKESDGGKYGAGFTNLEYALMAEVTGHTLIAPEVFNCSAPDTGNMEVLVRYGTPEQKEKWLTPLLNGDIRSCFAMTEPGVASSDATNMEATVRREGDELVLNGRKWWISGAGDPRCKIAIFMGRTYGDLSAVPPHKRHSMVLVPMDTPGVKIIRPMKVMGYDDAPHGHMEMLFQDVRVPLSNVLVGEGAGFEIAQGRLGPGRIHHCMRIIGAAERALELMCHRVTNRVAFGKYLAEQGTIQNDIALSRVEIDQARLLCLNAAYHMDVKGNKSAKDDIASIKIVAPRMAKNVIDRAIQSFGAMGLSQDTPLAHFWTWARILQLADGPDEVHLTALAKSEIKTQTPNFVSKRSKK